MALDDFLLELLVDPFDHGPLIYVRAKDVLVNPRTKRAYRVEDNIPVMLDDEARDLDDAELASLLAEPTAVETGGTGRA